MRWCWSIESRAFGLRVLGAGVGALMLAQGLLLTACGGTQNSTSAVPSIGRQSYVHRVSGSWMKRGSSGDTLLYVGLFFSGEVNVYTFPGGALVGQLAVAFPDGMCSDSSGNIWIAEDNGSYASTLEEFPHAGSSPIRTVSETDGYAGACSVDATTGDLAVASQYNYTVGYASIYTPDSGTPERYTLREVSYPNSAGYDSKGDLFIVGNEIYAAATEWLPKGASAFATYKLKKPHTYPHTGIAVNGKELTAIAHPWLIHRYTIGRHRAKYIGSMTLDGTSAKLNAFCIYGSTLVVSSISDGNVYFFSYPAGGYPTYTISGLQSPMGVAISVEPSRSRKHR